MKIQRILIVFLAGLFFFNFALAQKTMMINDKPFVLTREGKAIVWVFFKDKGPGEQMSKKTANQLLSPRAIQRRLKIKKPDNLIDYRDYPLHNTYVQALQPFVDKIRSRSRWLNAVSVEARPQRLEEINNLSFVEKISPVRPTRKPKPEPERTVRPLEQPLKKTTSLDYGASIKQVQLINADVLHDMGLYGQGVLICMLDDGFNLLYHHIAFDSLRLVATWDFTNNDTTVDDSEHEASEGWHGTKTLSTIGGYTPGELIGTAFKASFLLAKTEVDSSETPVEEDYWVAGIEWADSMGADIVSSSLGYIDWYTWEDMDGNTAVTTIAADIAVGKGMLVFNSAGNEYDNADHNTLIAPADGDSVMAVAATDEYGVRVSFSSVGPSADGRIKPDIAAMGSNVVCASQYNDTSFTYSSGTSFSCPIAAGGAALLLTAFPDSPPALIMEALRSTASHALEPDKYYGWGVIDLEEAYNYLNSTTIVSHEKEAFSTDNLYLYRNYPNPFNPSTKIRFSLNQPGTVHLTVYSVQGKRILSKNLGLQPAHTLLEYILDMKSFASGVYYYDVFMYETGSGAVYHKTGKMVLLK
ncbi:MAG TPA: T9SS type A sorting domain-containing protein [Calditrichaeota bacterium]|nr:T9SS type A sorting domain-containing protein [Calditrichota bacterium]